MAVVVAIIAATIALGGPVRQDVSAVFDAEACRVTNDCGGGGPLPNLSALVGEAGGAAAGDTLDVGLVDAITGAAIEATDGGGSVVDGLLDGLRTAMNGTIDGGSALLNGLVLGDYGSPEDNGVLEGIRIGGQIVSSILVVGDIRDGVRAGTEVITTGEGWGDLALIGVGLIPVGGDYIRGVGIVGESAIDAARSVDDVADAAGDIVRQGDDVVAAGDDVVEQVDEVVPGRELCSFSADTEVLTAAGTPVPISSLVVGDRVLSGDPETNRFEAQTVTQLWQHQDQMVDLVTDAGRITTTADHPFWSVTDDAWQAAADLDAGDELLTPSGDVVAVAGIDPASLHTGSAHNLSVSVLNTYVVRIGGSDVLVHNQNTCGPQERFPSTDPQVAETASAIDDAFPGGVQGHNVDVFRPDGTKLTDLDIVTDQAVVEVKTGRGRGLGAQVDRITEAMAQEGLDGRQLVVYLPDMPPSSAVAQEATRRGALVVHDLDELVGIVGP